MKFEVFRRLTMRGWKWYFRLRARNGKTVAQSEGYSRKIDAVQTVQSIKESAAQARVVDLVATET